MTDFYSVLRQSLIDRGLRSAEQRRDAYSQARSAMIRRLWSFDPPLAEDEIDARIGQFDIAVERIEGDLVATFARAEAAEVAVRREVPPARIAPVTVVDGYDEVADYAPAFGGQPLPLPTEGDDGFDDDGDDPWAEAAHRIGAAVPATPGDRRLMIEAAIRGVPPVEAGPEEVEGEAVVEAAEPAPRWRPAPVRRSAPAHEAARRDDPPHVTAADISGYGYEGDSPEADDDDVMDEPPPDRRARFARDDDPAFDEEIDEAPAYRPRRPRARPMGDQGKVRLLLVAVAALAVVLVATSAYVFVPLLSGSSASDGPGIPAGAPLPPNVGDPATAARIPVEPANVAQTITLFDGRDPTVFEADSNNPIRFTGSEADGFTSVSTSSSSAGARVVIGPGLSSRLAGQSIRVNIVARAARENGAASMRFAYQSGLAISHWQTATLSPEFTPFGLVWRVPTMRTNPSGDHIVIEPGIPGDRTAADIRSVTIDVLAQ